MRTNQPNRIYTHEGAPAKQISPEQQLRRTVLACLLWEETFYEDGDSVVTRIEHTCTKVSPETIAALAVEARQTHNLRHVPLLLLTELVRHGQGKMVGDTIYEVIQRPDELTELLALYWRYTRKPLDKQLKLGLARAFTKFDGYQLAKYCKRPGQISLRDVLYLVHARPKNRVQEQHWKHLCQGTLVPPNTWETRMTRGESPRAVFEDLLRTKSLGYLALLRNLRKMYHSGVEYSLVADALRNHPGRSKVLPLRYIAAMRACPAWESLVEEAMLNAFKDATPLRGKTAIVVDCSGSMQMFLSQGRMSSFDVAASLAILAREIADEVAIYAYGTEVKQVHPRRGMALYDELRHAYPGHGTRLGNAVARVNADGYDRAIIITDEQSRDSVPGPVGTGYVINVASYRHGIGYGPWTHIDGFSDALIKWIQEVEQL